MTIFTKVDYSLSALVEHIDMGIVGLPDIQRPFVWKNAKIRNLFDSMYRGYPIGYLLFWETGSKDDGRTIGTNQKQLSPNLLIVDGQQRLTSIYAVVRGIPVIRENYDSELIQIAFNPLEERFEVADAAIRRDKSFIPNISKLWSKESDIFDVAEEYMENVSESRPLSDEEKKRAKDAIKRLNNLLNFPFTALTLASNVDEEQVSDVFVRINSEGKKLNQSDFILTLMSVFWDEGRSQLEDFCRKARVPSTGAASPFNHFIWPDPDQLLRVSIGLGFRRARLSTVYSILRGKDLETEQFSPERRDEQFEVLKAAQARVLNLQYWHDFLKSLIRAGYRSSKMISSQNALLFSYTLYLLGKTEYNVDENTLRRVIAQWFFMSSLTGRYSSSPESKMEFDLARLRSVETGNEFIGILRRICDEILTQDYWGITLPNDLATSAARSPSMFAYFAALNLHDANVLFSKNTVTELLDPAINASKSSMERHHLFPKNYLKSIGVTDNREINQIANFTVLEWGDNVKISDRAPADYVAEYGQLHSTKDIEKMFYWHALPNNWHDLDYSQFLQQRRELMARVISDAYQKLASEGAPYSPDDDQIPLEALISEGETSNVEFKSTLRVNLHTKQNDPRMELAVLKTVAGFLNSYGGTLVIGVADDGNPIGIEVDNFPNEDKMNLHLVNILKERIGPQHMFSIHPRFDDYEGARVLIVECKQGKEPVYVKDGNSEKFYIRTGAATSELVPSQTQSYIKQRF